jgi:hypothetical protein
MPIDLLIFHNFSPPFMTHIISTPRPHLPHRAARKKCVRINQGINNSPPSPRQQTKLSPQRSGRKNHTSKSKLNTTQIVYNGFLSNQTTLAKLYTPTAVHKQTQPLHPSPPFKKKRDSFPTPPTTQPTKSNERKHAKYHPHPSHTPVSPDSKMWSILFTPQFVFSERLRHISEITSVTHNPDAT